MNPKIFEDLPDDERAQTISIYAPLLLNVINHLRNVPLNQKKIAEHAAKKIINLALWSVTEITNTVDDKYLNQRYISEGTFDLWNSLQINAGAKKADYTKGLRHEHVIPRLDLYKRLISATSAAQIITILNTSIACVVTDVEDKKLSRGGSGWSRYHSAGIKVFDRKKQIWI